jgi:hypothetical protein
MGNKEDNNKTEKHLRVFESKSEYYSDSNSVEIFEEGVVSKEAKKRIKEIKDAFVSGFLDQLICDLHEGKVIVDIDKVSDTTQQSLDGLVISLTSEVGRALIGLSIMQLCIKSIAPEQNIRLHKGSSNRGSFSWSEGVSMRTLDKNYVTPILRKHDLLRLNADGFMMTRSLAENYPYTFLYKANLRGARDQWLALVEQLESGVTEPLESLKFLLSKLLNAASDFNNSADKLVETIKIKLAEFSNRSIVIGTLLKHLNASDYAARLLEVSMHALMQAAVSTGALGDLAVKPISQMRSANKKHGNIGDIELLEDGDIVESWDAKYGKSYLREEIEEAVEKLLNHNHVKKIGFVTDGTIDRTTEIIGRIEEIQSLYSVKFEVLTFTTWVDQIYQRCLSSDLTDETKLSNLWITIYCEYLSQKRRDQAPIDEPCADWVTSLTKILCDT